MPKQGHLEAVLNIMGYLKLQHNSKLVFDPPYPNIEHSNFWGYGWTDFMRVQWKLYHLMLHHHEERLCMFVNTNHASNK